MPVIVGAYEGGMEGAVGGKCKIWIQGHKGCLGEEKKRLCVWREVQK